MLFRSTLLFRIDPTQNMARFYILAIEPTLFGGSSLTRCWGRMGTKGQTKIDLFDTPVEAMEASKRLLMSKLRRGYGHNAVSGSAQKTGTPLRISERLERDKHGDADEARSKLL